MKISKIYFTTEDKLKLTGLLYTPEEKSFFPFRFKEPKKVVIFIHGMYSDCLRKRDDIFAEELTKNGYAYFTFNNRGAEVGYMIRDVLYGTAFEDPMEGRYDIDAAIEAMKNEGFEEIYLFGHSLGCTKILIWNKYKKNKVSAIGLLSLTALSEKYKQQAGENTYKVILNFAKLRVARDGALKLLPAKFYPKPISARTFLTIFGENSEFNCVSYEDENWDAKVLNDLEVPLFMRYATINETITKKPEEIIAFLKGKLKNEVDLSYIEGTDHSYHGKERELIRQYIAFLRKNK
ncbi:MAG: alpha/beta hydrolase [Clostridia bacterium]|nr:alpha/beta hydrolase [Clostridia bacterium]